MNDLRNKLWPLIISQRQQIREVCNDCCYLAFNSYFIKIWLVDKIHIFAVNLNADFFRNCRHRQKFSFHLENPNWKQEMILPAAHSIINWSPCARLLQADVTANFFQPSSISLKLLFLFFLCPSVTLCKPEYIEETLLNLNAAFFIVFMLWAGRKSLNILISYYKYYWVEQNAITYCLLKYLGLHYR